MSIDPTLAAALVDGRREHEGLMLDTVQLHRPGPPVFDRDTGLEVPGPDTVLYEGRARVKPMRSLKQDVEAGEREIVLRQYEVALPWSAPIPDRVLPGDVLDVSASLDGRLAGLRLWVTSVQYGATATAWRLSTEDRS